MPPKRKRQPEPPPMSPDAEANHDTSQLAPPPTFYNTTFTPHRISPLHVGSNPLNASRLRVLEKHLRDALVGDVVRGVQVGLEGDATLGRAGVLESVEWRWVGLRRLLGNGRKKRRRNHVREGSADLGNESVGEEEEDGREEENEDEPKALTIELHYENNTFLAILLPNLSSEPETESQLSSLWTPQLPTDVSREGAPADAFVHLPLLLVRMPTPLKTLLIDFLSTTFDVRISALRFGTRTLVTCWEGWLSSSGMTGRTKDVALTLGFHIEPPAQTEKGDEGTDSTQKNQPSLGLKAIDIIIPVEEVARFVRAGEKIQQDLTQQAHRRGKKKAGAAVSSNPMSPSRRRRLAGGKDEEGWAWRVLNDGATEDDGSSSVEQPFTETLGAYLSEHLALDLFHPGVRILKIACDDFVMGENRVKIFGTNDENGGGNNKAVWQLVEGLINKAKGKQFWEVSNFT